MTLQEAMSQVIPKSLSGTETTGAANIINNNNINNYFIQNASVIEVAGASHKNI